MQVKGGLEGFPMMLVGNKCDEEAGRQKRGGQWKGSDDFQKQNPDRTLGFFCVLTKLRGLATSETQKVAFKPPTAPM